MRPCLALLGVFLSVQMLAASQALAQTTLYEGASVWTGEAFVEADVAVRDGVFISPAEAGPEVIRVDVAGKFISPPYANAHQHITNAGDEQAWSFLEHGVFYVWNPNLISTAWSAEDAAYFARAETLDVRTSMGGITEPRGHPEKLYVDILSEYVYPNMADNDFLGTAFHYGRTPEEIDAALDLLVTQGATFVKAYLLGSGDYLKRKKDDSYYGRKGLNPDNMAYLVHSAHQRGLPVAVHVETAADLRMTASAGADMLAHLPGYGRVSTEEDLAAIAITAEDAALVSQSGMMAVPTYALARLSYDTMDEADLDEAFRDRHFAVQADTLRRLADAGAKILTGTDAAKSIYDETRHWVEIGGLTEAEALQSVYETGPMLFPTKRIGRIEPGYAADFLVLDANPAEDLANLSSVSMRVKAGQLLPPPDAE